MMVSSGFHHKVIAWNRKFLIMLFSPVSAALKCDPSRRSYPSGTWPGLIGNGLISFFGGILEPLVIPFPKPSARP